MPLNRDQWETLRRELVARVDELAAAWLPTGSRVGGKWVAGDARGAPGDSLNLALAGDKVGLWFDHGAAAEGEKSGDLVHLRAVQLGITDAEAGERLWIELGLDAAPATGKPPARPSAPRKGKGSDADLVPADVAASDASWEWAKSRGMPGETDGAPPVRFDLYERADGLVSFRVLRFNRPTPDDPTAKQFRPLSPFLIEGAVRWKYKDPPGLLPLYRLPDLIADPAAPVVVCEGEKAARAAADLLPDWVATTSSHGCKSADRSDWSPLAGRRVVVWPDYDKPGAEYAAAVVALVPGARILDVSALASFLDWNIPAKADAADVPAEVADSVRVAFRDPPLLPVAGAPRDPAKPPPPPSPKPVPEDDDGDDGSESAQRARTYRLVVASISTAIEQSGTRPNALNGWRRKVGGSADTGDDEILADFIHEWRWRGRPGERVIPAAFEKVVRDMRRARRAELVASMTGRASTDAGRAELRRWVVAVAIGMPDGMAPAWIAQQTERVNFLVEVMRHWMWGVKRYALGLSVEAELMPVLYGPQKSGKTWAIEGLAAPWEELSLPITAAALTDDRQAQVLYRGLIARWDELEGAHKADVDALKRSITSKTVAFRNLYSNAIQERLRTCSFIASTNQPVRHVIKDPTGARRYVQIETPVRCDWDALRAIDMRRVWDAVSELDVAPIKSVLTVLGDHQKRLVHQDAVCSWLLDETWDDITFRPSDAPHVVTLKGYLESRGLTMNELAQRHAVWARRLGQAPMVVQALGARLRQLGFTEPRKCKGTPDRPAGRYYTIPPEILGKSAAWMEGVDEEAEAGDPDPISGGNF
jgi:hypothetical protein